MLVVASWCNSVGIRWVVFWLFIWEAGQYFLSSLETEHTRYHEEIQVPPQDSTGPDSFPTGLCSKGVHHEEGGSPKSKVKQ